MVGLHLQAFEAVVETFPPLGAAAPQPLATGADHQEVQFREDQAEFIRRDGALVTSMDVLVSGEDDGEVRRVSLCNNGRRTREIEATSYAELVLTRPD